MKILSIILAYLFTSTLFASELNWVDEQVEAIKPPRSGVNSKELSSIRDPFIFLKKNKPKKISKSGKKVTYSLLKKHIKTPKYFKLTMIMNHSALINGKWYKEEELISGYKITEVNLQSVLLTKHKKQILLSTQSKIKTLNFKHK